MPHGYVFVLLCYIGRDDSYNSQGVVYTYRREASRCSFRRTGNARALKHGASNRYWLHAFFIVNGTIMCRMRPVAHIKTLKHYETCEEFLSKERPPHDGHGYEFGICIM